MAKLLSWPRYAGPLITFVLILVNQALILSGVFPVQVAWLYLPATFAAMTGLLPGLISAALVAFYSIWLDPTDPQRVFIVPLSILALATGVGLQSRALRASLADALEAREALEAALIRAHEGEEAVKAMTGLNGNIERILKARDMVLGIVNTAELLPPVRAELGVVLHTLNNLLYAVKGWQEYAELRERLGKEKVT